MKRVLLAMSGGIDSSFAAYELKRQGYEVIGVFLNMGNFGLESDEMARKVAQKLGIRFYNLNYQDEFKKEVVDYFLREYKAGRTPNPCVICNEKIKFGKLLDEAKRQGCDYLATGHYVRVLSLAYDTKTRLSRPSVAAGLGLDLARPDMRRDTLPARSPNGLLSHKLALFKGIDETKDQSYFLWRLKSNQLKYLKFPCGDYKKSEVKRLIKKWKLPSAERAESQEICFVSGALADFLAKYLRPKPGFIKDKSGKILGKHKGLPFYTIGQRRDLGLGNRVDNPAFDPYYVVGANSKNNILIVGKEKDLYSKKLIADSVNWLNGGMVKWDKQFNKSTNQQFNKFQAKIRYGTETQACRVKLLKNDRMKVEFKKSQRSITPGQSIVLYREEELIGGGVIAH